MGGGGPLKISTTRRFASFHRASQTLYGLFVQTECLENRCNSLMRSKPQVLRTHRPDSVCDVAVNRLARYFQHPASDNTQRKFLKAYVPTRAALRHSDR